MKTKPIDIDKTLVDMWDIQRDYYDKKEKKQKKYIPKIATLTLRKALSYFKTDMYKSITLEIRDLVKKKSSCNNEEDAKEYQTRIDQIKAKKLQAFTFGSTYDTKRDKNHLISCSGLITLDYDEVKDMEKNQILYKKISDLPYVFMCCYSPSGGLKFLARIPVVTSDEEYKSYLYGFVVYLKNLLNIQLDTSGQDINRLCFISYDENMYVNEHAEIFDIKATKEDAIPSNKTLMQKATGNQHTESASFTEEKKQNKIPKYCSLIENVHAKTYSETGGGYVKHNYLDPFVYNYCITNNKSELLSQYKTTHNRDDGAFNNSEELGFNCGSLISYTKARLGLEHINETCKKCDVYKDYVSKITDHEDEIEIIRDKQNLNFGQYAKHKPVTTHLFLFENLQSEIGYKGSKETEIAKIAWYRTNALMQKPQLINITKKIATDNRFHGILIGQTNTGKGLYKTFEKRFCNKNNISYVDVSSISNTQQMIGKMLKLRTGKKVEYVANFGYMNNKNLLQDEIGYLLNEEKDIAQETMRVIRLGLDAYGENEIGKKLTGDEATLKYCPQCNYLGFIHPQNLSEKFIKSGTFRRFSFIHELNGDKIIDVKKIGSFLDEDEDLENYSDLISAYYSLSRKNDLSYTNESKLLMEELFQSFFVFLLSHDNIGIKKYAICAKWGLKLLFAKMINILHIAHNKTRTENELVLHAFIDFFEIQLLNIESLMKYTRFDIQEGTWSDLKEEEVLILDYLFRKGATSEENSTVSVKRFVNVVGEITGLHERQTKNVISLLKSKNYINSKQVGRTDSKVWLLSVPTDYELQNTKVNLAIFEETIKGCKGCKDLDTYTKNTMTCQMYYIYYTYIYFFTKGVENVASLASLKKKISEKEVMDYIGDNNTLQDIYDKFGNEVEDILDRICKRGDYYKPDNRSIRRL